MVDRIEVAKRCGVSAMTVSRVVNKKGYVSEETRKKVEKTIKELGYIPNRLASNLVRKLGNEVAIILPDLTNPYYLQVIDAMTREAKKYGYIISIFKAEENELPDILENTIAMRVAGIVNYGSPFPKEYEKPLREIGAKVVRGDIFEAGFKLEINYRDAIFEAVKQLKEDGRKNIAFVSGMDKEYTFSDIRPKNYLEALENWGMQTGKENIFFGNYPHENAFEVGKKAAKEIINSGTIIDAAFCMNDMMALGAITALYNNGLKVPQDVSVIGCDYISISKYVQPTLTTLKIDKFAYGREIAKTIIDKIENPDMPYTHRIIEAEPVFRESLSKAKI